MRDDERLQQDDQDARDRALDVTRSFIVQAPAGSGKTELLIQRYLRLLATVDDPEEVIAITFTRKASAEMQYRVLGALHGAGQGVMPEAPHEQLTAEFAAAVLARSEARGWDLLANPRRLRIQTLDALNRSITRTRPLTAPGSTSGIPIVTDAELAALHREAAEATLDYLTTSGDYRDAAVEVLEHLDNNTSTYVSYLARMLSTRDQWLPFTGSGELTPGEAAALRRVLEGNLEVVVRAHLELARSLLPAALIPELEGIFDYAAANLRADGKAGHPVAALAGLSKLPPAEPGATVQWIGIAELLLTGTGTVRKTVTKLVGFPPEGKQQKGAMLAVLEELADDEQLADVLHGVRSLPATRYSDEQWQVLLALFRLLPLASGELRSLFAARGVADHVEIAINAGAALGSAEDPGDVALLLDYQVSHLLIDEMQDTSSAQYRMLEALTGGWEHGDGRTLFCVGDPMQSIYRFRNAEVGQFLLAREHGIGDVQLEPLVLRRNFRSGERLVDWFNQVFPGILAARDDAGSGAISYAEAVSVAAQAGIGRCEVHPVFGADQENEARIGCRVIAETLAAHPQDTMAVLVSGRNHLPQLVSQLRLAGIDYQSIDIDKLTDLPEIIEVLALTRAAVHPGDRVAWLGLLRAPWAGLDWTDLHVLVQGERYATVPELLRDPARLAALSKSGRAAVERLLPVLDRLQAPRRSQTLRDLVEDCWLALGGPALLANGAAVDNVYRYFDVLAKHERTGSLDDVAALETLLDLERVSASGSARLQIMTMHKAKGLEFEHVLLYGLGRRPGSSGRSVLSWFDLPDEHGAERKIISPVGPRVEVDNDPVHRYIEQAEAAKDRYERGRLLYVACTRARKSLHLLGHAPASPEGCKPPEKQSLLRMLWPAVEEHFEAAFAPDLVADNQDREAFIAPVLRRFESPWSAPAIEPLPGEKTPTEDAAPQEEQVEYYWVGTGARIAGTVVHRWLQVLAEGRIVGDPADPALRAALTRRWLREMGIDDALHAGIATRVSAALDGILDDPRGRWVLDGDGQAELALTGLYDGEIEAVIIDRVRIDDGEHWIIDYKTSTHEGGNLQGFLDAEITRYTPQLRKYAKIYAAYTGTRPRCALYFPLLQQFVEVQ